jgi:hypothetical protein
MKRIKELIEKWRNGEADYNKIETCRREFDGVVADATFNYCADEIEYILNTIEAEEALKELK